MEDEFSTAGRGINVFCEASKTNVPLIKLGDGFNEVFEGAAKPVKPLYNEGVPFPDVGEPGFTHEGL